MTIVDLIELVFKAFRNRKRSDFVDCNRSDRVNETIFSLNWSYSCLDDEYNCECSQIRYTKGTGAIHFS